MLLTHPRSLVVDVPTVKLNSGYTIPQVGFGTWQAAPKEVEHAVFEALKAGYRHLDLAKVYRNQDEVAAGIKRSGVPRESLFITSKLWNTSHRPEHVEAALDDTLKELDLDYLDLYLMHWPVAFKPVDDGTKELFPLIDPKADTKKIELDLTVSVVDTWRAMIKLLDTGKVKSIGVSNFTIEAVDELIRATDFTPAVNQIERHPLLPQPELVKHHAEKNIHITAYSPLGNNLQGHKKLFEYDDVKAIAKRIGATPAQVLISWGALSGHSVIPKSVTPERIQSNFTLVALSQEDIQELNAFGDGSKRKRFNIPFNYKPTWDVDIFGEADEASANHNLKLI